MTPAGRLDGAGLEEKALLELLASDTWMRWAMEWDQYSCGGTGEGKLERPAGVFF